MSFFKKPASYANTTPSTPTHPGVPRFQQKGDRTLIQRQEQPEPEFRRKGETFEGRKKVGLTNNVVIDRLPRGCLFKVAGGFFDLDGYWCVPKADHYTEVRRGSPKKIMKLLTPAQRHELARVRLNARRRGVR